MNHLTRIERLSAVAGAATALLCCWALALISQYGEWWAEGPWYWIALAWYVGVSFPSTAVFLAVHWAMDLAAWVWAGKRTPAAATGL